MSPSTAMRRPRPARLRLAEQRQRGAHRGRIGVVALVDQGEARRPGWPSAMPLAAPLRRAETRPSASMTRARSAPTRLRGGEHGERVLHEVPPRRAEPVGRPSRRRRTAWTLDPSALQRRRAPAACRRQGARRRRGCARRAPRARSASRSNQRLSRLRTAVAARLQALEDLGLGLGDRRLAVEDTRDAPARRW